MDNEEKRKFGLDDSNTVMTIREAKLKGIKTVLLNGFKENIDYVLSLRNITWTAEIIDNGKTYQCYITK